VLTFSVIAEAHLGLSKTDGVFSCCNAIEFLKLGLVDALGTKLAWMSSYSKKGGLFGAYLAWEINFNGLDADVFRS